MLADIFLGDADGVEQERLARYQRAAASPETAAALLELCYRNDVQAELEHVRAPTFVVHRRADRAIPYHLGRELAAAIPGATLIPLDGSAHFPWAGDSPSVARALRSVLAPEAPARVDGEPAAVLLSGRERQVLALVASGVERSGDRRTTRVELPHRASPRREHSPQARAAVPERRRSQRRRAWACSETDHPNGPSWRRWPGRAMRACNVERAYRRPHARHDITSQIESPAGSCSVGARCSRPCTTRSCGSASGPGCALHRKELLARARGRTVEIGAGTGLNVPHYPDDLDELFLVEPDAAMRSRLAKSVRRSGRRARLVDAPAEHLPFADGSVDTVVSTFVLCTVDAPDLALREIARVLQPDGQLLFIEHVRSESPTLARWQDRLAEPWRRFATRLSLQSGDRGADRDLRVRARPRARRVMARHAADRATADRRPRAQGSARPTTVSRVADEAWMANATGRFTDG